MPGEHSQGSSRQFDLEVRNHQYMTGNSRIRRDEKGTLSECWGEEMGPGESPGEHQSLKGRGRVREKKRVRRCSHRDRMKTRM